MGTNENDLEKRLAAAAAEDTVASRTVNDIQSAVSIFDGWDTPNEPAGTAAGEENADETPEEAQRRLVQNRRSFSRRAVQLKGEIRHRQRMIDGSVIDVSRSGLMFRTCGEVIEIEDGSWLTIRFDHPHPRVATQIERVAQVVRRDSYYDGAAWLHSYGIRFVDHLAEEELTFADVTEKDVELKPDQPSDGGTAPADELARAIIRTVEAQMRRDPRITHLAALVALEKTRDELRRQQAEQASG